MTLLEMVNNILLRLREDTVSTVAETAYAKLIATFVNDAKQDVEDVNHSWSAYETEIDLSILGDSTTRIYAVTGTNDRSYLLRDGRPGNDRCPLAFDITANGQRQLHDSPLKAVRYARALSDDNTEDNPYIFAVQADNATGAGWQIQLVWASTTARTWRMYWYVPQDDLAIDGTDDNTQILLPIRPVETKAIYYALNERGEEMGEPNGIAFQRAKDSLAAALETDMQVQKKSDELDITNHENL